MNEVPITLAMMKSDTLKSLFHLMPVEVAAAAGVVDDGGDVVAGATEADLTDALTMASGSERDTGESGNIDNDGALS